MIFSENDKLKNNFFEIPGKLKKWLLKKNQMYPDFTYKLDVITNENPGLGKLYYKKYANFLDEYIEIDFFFGDDVWKVFVSGDASWRKKYEVCDFYVERMVEVDGFSFLPRLNDNEVIELSEVGLDDLNKEDQAVFEQESIEEIVHNAWLFSKYFNVIEKNLGYEEFNKLVKDIDSRDDSDDILTDVWTIFLSIAYENNKLCYLDWKSFANAEDVIWNLSQLLGKNDESEFVVDKNEETDEGWVVEGIWEGEEFSCLIEEDIGKLVKMINGLMRKNNHKNVFVDCSDGGSDHYSYILLDVELVDWFLMHPYFEGPSLTWADVIPE